MAPGVAMADSPPSCLQDGGDVLALRLAALDPQMALDTPSAHLSLSGSPAAVALCCPECRRPFCLELSRQGSACLRARLRNPHDLPARWVAATEAVIAVPAWAECSVGLAECPHCRREIHLEVTRTVEAGQSDMTGSLQTVNGANQSFAYATLLYGSTVDYFIGALVLGWTLKKPVLEPERTSRYRMLLLHTDDVPLEYLQVLSSFWELRRVAYLSGCTRMYYDYNGSRFKEVFTKLQALSLLDFDKVLMLDNDLLVRRNIDELFDLQAPAALKRPGGRDQPDHGQQFLGVRLWGWRKLEQDEDTHGSVDGWKYDMMSGINAGVMLLRPDQSVYNRMLAEIADNRHPEHLDCYGPEQEYLGRFYSAFGPGWTHMDARFNYQPLLGRGANRFMRNLDARREVAIAHFSGPRIKPWAGLVARNEALGPESLGRLLCETTGDFAVRFPENPALPATGAERAGEKGHPTLVVGFLSEWLEELRLARRSLCEEQAADLVAVVATVRGRDRGFLEKLARLALILRRRCGRGVSMLVPLALMMFFLLLRQRGLGGVIRRALARSLYSRPLTDRRSRGF